MLPRLLMFGLTFSYVLLADEEAKQRVHVTTTEHLDFSPGGTLRLQNSMGELTVEGWDRPEVEVTVTKSTKDAYAQREQESATRTLDRISVKTERHGDELVIATSIRHRSGPPPLPWRRATHLDVEYHVKAPANTRLVVNHNTGEVHVDNLSSDIEVKALSGEITLSVPPEGEYLVDAKSNWGDVTSDFPGAARRKPWLIGRHFMNDAPAAPHKLHLRIGYGDIAILKMVRPPEPAPPRQ
ncbi:MAG TPA: DUF4097 family beta strand repeat-containing protein [Bryobacteraceae bacterium]|nr:DUF4097 family beta strand repeat-containing protein [Bryobacteraceae bacterium]